MKNELFAYSSVRGSLHEVGNIKNQDNYTVRRYSYGTVLVMADGLGSKPFADIGSKSACRAVCKAIQIWNQYKEKDFRLLLPLIQSMWMLEIYPHTYNECSSTCLFAYITKQKDIYIGQLGDGDIYIEVDSVIHCVHKKSDEFSNITECLGSSTFDKWTIQKYHAQNKAKIAMMTDGVSETLVSERKEEFIKKIWRKLSTLGTLQERNAFMFNLLNQWNPINAGDDRTIIGYEIC